MRKFEIDFSVADEDDDVLIEIPEKERWVNDLMVQFLAMNAKKKSFPVTALGLERPTDKDDKLVSVSRWAQIAAGQINSYCKRPTKKRPNGVQAHAVGGEWLPEDKRPHGEGTVSVFNDAVYAAEARERARTS